MKPVSMSGTIPIDFSNPTSATPIDGVAPDGKLLPAPLGVDVPVGDVGAKLAALLIVMGRDERNVAKSARAMKEKAQENAEDAQVAAMREKADDAFTSGLIGGFSSMVGGAVGTVQAYRLGEVKTPHSEVEAATTNRDVASTSARYGAIGKSVDGAGKLGSAKYQRNADDENVEATHEEQIASHHKKLADDARDAADDAKKLIEKAIDFYKDYTSAKSDAQKAAMLRA